MKEELVEPQKKSRWSWLALLLLPVVLFLPLLGESIQKVHIGDEEYCCASFLTPEVVERTEHAKSLHWLSNVVIGGSIILAVLMLVLMVFILYKYAVPQITTKGLRHISGAVIAVVITPVALLVLCVAFYFIFDNHEYYVHRAQAPDNGIYGDFFYKELFYLTKGN